MIVGLVGKPSAGKSTFFKAATLAEVEIANYPFTTIEKNEGVAYVKVEDVAREFSKTSNPKEGYVLGSYRFVPVKLIDVAGLVPDAHKGKGRGNQFLDDLRQADVLIHIVDASGSLNAQGEPIGDGEYEPINDIQFLETELDMWYLEILKKGWERFARKIQQEQLELAEALAKQLSGLKVTEEHIKEAQRELNLYKNILSWEEKDLVALAINPRKKTKPILIAANKIDRKSSEKNIQKLKQENKEYKIVPCSAEAELALKEAAKKEIIEYIPGEEEFSIKKELTEKQKEALEFIKKEVLARYKSTGVQEVLNTAVFNLLEYIAVFPGGMNKLEDSKGNVLPDCFLLPKESTALDFAYHLHTDFGKNFIKAFDVRTKRVIGKEHKLKHKDIIEIAARK